MTPPDDRTRAERETIELTQPTLTPGSAWQPVVGDEARGLLASIGLDAESQQLVLTEAANVLGKCVPPSHDAGGQTGLVLGYVQSGKTMSFTTVAALARDNGYQMVIAITGTSVSLLNQSTERLVKDLRLQTRADRKWHRFQNPTAEGSTLRNIRNTLLDWDDASVPPSERRTVLITVMKHAGHLDNLIGVLETLQMGGRPVIVIDDEADQAGLNTGVRKGVESATYQRLLRLRRALPHHSYLQYTATPQAPLLINLLDALSPRFAELLTPGDMYVGGREFFGGDDSLVRTVPDVEIPSAQNVLSEPPDSLLEALRIFFLGVAAGFLRDRGDGNRSMLVHPSQRTYDHGTYFTWVQSVAKHWQDCLALDVSDADRTELIESFQEADADLRATVPDLPPFVDLVAQLSRAMRQTRIEEVNTRGGETPLIDWKAAYPYILVGGQAMDRGFTVEGLTVTYMPRGVGVGNADNVQQRARFLGYKRDYLGYCRVFLEAAARDAYTKYVVHEEDVRDRLRDHIREGKPLIEWKREFFLTSRLKPTRKSVLSLDYMRIVFGDQWWNPGAPHHALEAIEDNREVISRFLTELELQPDDGHPSRTSIMRHFVDHYVPLGNAFANLLTQYRVTTTDDSQRFTALRLLIQRSLETEPDAKCSVYHMSGGSERERSTDDEGCIENLFQGAHPDSRGTIYPGDRKIRRDKGITVQVHNVKVLDSEAQYSFVPVLAVWIPREIADDLIVQEAQARDVGM